MNIFTDVLFLFIYLLTLFFFRIPNITNNSYITHKFYLFIAVFGYYYAVQLIKKIKIGCKVDPYSILHQSLNMAIYCVLGYAIFVDLLYMDWSKEYFGSIENTSRRLITCASVVVSFVTLIKLIIMVFMIQVDDCTITNY